MRDENDEYWMEDYEPTSKPPSNEPTPPTNPEPPSIINNAWNLDTPVHSTDLQSDSLPLELTDTDLEELETTKLNKKVFLNEMDSCDMYLNNLHSSFKYASSVRSVIALVNASLSVHRHRRIFMAQTSMQCAQTEEVEYDVMGNVIKKPRR